MKLRDAPPADHGSGNGNSRARTLRATPDKWGLYRDAPFRTRQLAQLAASKIRNGVYPAWSPRGAWDAEAITDERGAHYVWVRYVG